MVDVLQALVNGVLAAGVYALVALGLTLILGLLDVANFAHGQAIMVGAYVAFFSISIWGVPFVVATVLALVASGVVGLVLERGVFRRTGVDHLRALTASLGLILAFESLASYLFTPNPRILNSPLSGLVAVGPIDIPKQRGAVFLVAAVLVAAFYFYAQKSRSGLALRAVADSREGAALMGVNLKSTNMAVFIIGSALAGAGGALLATLFPITPYVGDIPMLKGFIVAIVGGLGSVPGVIAASLILGITESVGARFLSAAFRDGYGFIVLIVVLLARPNGLFGLSREERL